MKDRSDQFIDQCHTQATFVLTCFLPREQGVRSKILHDLLAVLWVKLFKSCCQAGRQEMTINKTFSSNTTSHNVNETFLFSTAEGVTETCRYAVMSSNVYIDDI